VAVVPVTRKNLKLKNISLLEEVLEARPLDFAPIGADEKQDAEEGLGLLAADLDPTQDIFL